MNTSHQDLSRIAVAASAAIADAGLGKGRLIMADTALKIFLEGDADNQFGVMQAARAIEDATGMKVAIGTRSSLSPGEEREMMKTARVI